MCRVVQEALTHIGKYAKARHVWRDLVANEGWAEGGTLNVVSAPGPGTTLRVTLPQGVSPDTEEAHSKNAYPV